MGRLDQVIKERMAEAVARSYYRPWHRRMGGRFFLLFLGLIGFGLVYFAYLTVSSVSHIRRGDIYNRDIGTWISEDQFVANQKLVAEVVTEDDPWLGASEPLIFVVAYESFACPFCKADQPEIKKMLAEFGSIVRFVTKDFPTEGLHPDVFSAHLAAGCAQDQGKYWEYRDLLFANQGDFKKDNLKKLASQLGLNARDFNQCLDQDKYNQEIRQDYASGVQAGAIGTPSYVINSNLIPGAISFDMWKKIIAFILKEGY